MAFISRARIENREVGQWVRLKHDVEVLSGVFTAGTRMKITDAGSGRGPSLIDENGNKLVETFGVNFEPADDPRYDFSDKQ